MEKLIQSGLPNTLLREHFQLGHNRQKKQDLRQSGSKGFVGKRQTRDWKWTIEVTNSHTQPVAVRVEDPEPQIGDSAIEVKVVAKPAPVVKDHVNTWNLTVPASGKSVIDYTVEVDNSLMGEHHFEMVVS